MNRWTCERLRDIQSPRKSSFYKKHIHRWGLFKCLIKKEIRMKRPTKISTINRESLYFSHFSFIILFSSHTPFEISAWEKGVLYSEAPLFFISN